MISLSELLANLPPEAEEAALFGDIQQAVADSGRTLVVIDDDPTGTQTVHDVELLTSWNPEMLAQALRARGVFYVLTNSRSMPEREAVQVYRELAQQLVGAAREAGVDFVVASRSDSTLRGHYPAEIVALARGLTTAGGEEERCDGHLVVPAFFEGGRYTIHDTQYVATPTATADTVLPANETAFARDTVFGYTTAYLPAWIEEKSGRLAWMPRQRADQVMRIGLELIRQGGPAEVAARLQTVVGGVPVVINAAGYGDLAVVVLGLLRAEAAGKRFMYRTAASFVRLRGAITSKPLLQIDEIFGKAQTLNTTGGMVVVGSHVPDSSTQLANVLTLPNVIGIELAVERVIHSTAEAQAVSREAGQHLEVAIQAGRVGVVYTSRTLVTSANRAENLEIGKRVSQALIATLHHVRSRPRFIIAKGGITSHDVAQKGLGAARARVLGQLFPGVAVWRLEAGPQLRFEGVPYVVFPGNVGDPESLMHAVKMLSGTT